MAYTQLKLNLILQWLVFVVVVASVGDNLHKYFLTHSL